MPNEGRTAGTLHLISGLPASGKTTYATDLRRQVDGVLFCLDRWLITLFGRYSLPEVGQDEHTRRVLACRELIWDSASELLQRSVDVILDDGFFYREHRMRHVALAASIGAAAKIHFVDTPLDELRVRLERRNADLPRYNFHINPATLEGFLDMLERPLADEATEVVVVRR
jgi:predicted kinase